jgi:para-nitrobenzyl esterase
MPEASGLYRNTINMSGSGAFHLLPPGATERVSDELLKVLALPKADARKLQQIGAEQLYAAHVKALANLKADQARPVIDGRHIAVEALSPRGIMLQSAVPGIMSCTATEATPWLLGNRSNLQISAEDLLARVKAQYRIGEPKAREVIAAYQASGAGQSPWDLLVSIASDALMRVPMQQVTEMRAKAGAQPVYLADFAWRSSIEGEYGAGPMRWMSPSLSAILQPAATRRAADRRRWKRHAILCAPMSLSRPMDSLWIPVSRRGPPMIRLPVSAW